MKLGIISSMSIEIELILGNCKDVKEVQLKQNIFYQCKFEKYELIVVSSGVGKTNASVYTQILIDHFEPDAVINTGVGGGLLDNLEPFDVVLGTSFSYHDVRLKQLKNTFPFKSQFKADRDLVTVFSEHFPEEKRGEVVSGESFIDDSLEKEKIHKQHKALIVDMETASMAHCCFINDIPFISLTAISDLADDLADKIYYENDKEAADCAGNYLLEILKEEENKLIN
ncbi:5'-methylthioadenosine/S-adenosylhomocysteine nucleosidase [Vagococcus sp.]|uniref:5'-methylthioadenosine/S-adenosylhomocysteine nucleosidase n=1 Tax=Vagococcus sp. TaxID=1933889 RepID=UPI002FCB1C45